MDKNFINFFKKNHIVTIGFNSSLGVYLFNAFYIFINNNIIFASSTDAFHTKEFRKNLQISGTIFKNTKLISKIEGIQFLANLDDVNDKEKMLYSLNYPVRIVKNIKIFKAKIYWAKYTSNNLGFGHKEIFSL